jgi:metal-responsive CopG/Arc/MetJ family transcriptional regulator
LSTTSQENIARFGVIFPKETLEKVEKHKGRYMSRNRYIVRAVEHYLTEQEGEKFLEVNE